MRPRCNFIFFTLLFTFYPLACGRSHINLKCCSTFSRRFRVKHVIMSYHVTHPECQRSGIIFITKAQRKICADPRERWVQRLKNLLDARNSARPTEIWARPESAVGSSKVDRVAKKTESIRTSETAPLQRPEETTLVHLIDSNDWLDFDTTQANPNTEKTESIRTSETAPLQRPEETTLVHLIDSNDWLDFDTTQANPNTEKTESIRTSETAPLQRPEETTLVHLIDSNDWLDFDTTQANPNTEMASESVGTRGRTRIQRADESAVVHLKESAYFCMKRE